MAPHHHLRPLGLLTLLLALQANSCCSKLIVIVTHIKQLPTGSELVPPSLKPHLEGAHPLTNSDIGSILTNEEVWTYYDLFLI